jgi:glutathione S-transferase
MKLYSSPISPFGCRVTMAARAKGITIDAAPIPAGGIKSPEYLKINPVGKIPVLITDNDRVIAESEAILHYLEQIHPKPSILPANAEDRAHGNVLVRMLDTYVSIIVIRMFPHIDPKSRDEKVVEQELARWNDGLNAVAHFMATPPASAEAGVSVADCALSTGLHLSSFIAKRMGLYERLVKPKALEDYFAKINQNPIVGPVLADLTAAQKAKFG